MYKIQTFFISLFLFLFIGCSNTLTTNIEPIPLNTKLSFICDIISSYNSSRTADYNPIIENLSPEQEYELINYCSNNNEVWKRLITISSTTLAVGISCYFLQAFTPILQWYQSFMDIIPSWLVIAQDKVIITIKK